MVVLGMKTEGFGSARSAIRGLREGVQTEIAGVRSMLAGAFTIGAAVGITKAVINMAEAWKDVSEQSGESLSDVQKYDAAFKKVGGTVSDAVKIWDELAIARKEALEKGGESGVKLQKLGLTAQEIQSLDTGRKLFERIAQISNDTTNKQHREAFIAQFGKKKGGMALAGASAFAEGEFPTILSDENIKTLDEAGKAFERASLEFKLAAAPLVAGMFSWVKEAVKFYKGEGTADEKERDKRGKDLRWQAEFKYRRSFENRVKDQFGIAPEGMLKDDYKFLSETFHKTKLEKLTAEEQEKIQERINAVPPLKEDVEYDKGRVFYTPINEVANTTQAKEDAAKREARGKDLRNQAADIFRDNLNDRVRDVFLGKGPEGISEDDYKFLSDTFRQTPLERLSKEDQDEIHARLYKIRTGKDLPAPSSVNTSQTNQEDRQATRTEETSIARPVIRMLPADIEAQKKAVNERIDAAFFTLSNPNERREMLRNKIAKDILAADKAEVEGDFPEAAKIRAGIVDKAKELAELERTPRAEFKADSAAAMGMFIGGATAAAGIDPSLTVQQDIRSILRDILNEIPSIGRAVGNNENLGPIDELQ